MEADGPYDYLEWDSRFFSCRIARVHLPRLSCDSLPGIMEWCAQRRIDCLYFLAGSDDDESVRTAEQSGFRLVDIRVALERGLNDAVQDARESRVLVRECRAEDLPALRAIARVSHRDTRFYHDPNFVNARCDALYETWIERSFQGYADAVLVAEADGHPVGYVSCHLDNATDGRIGLLAVDENARGAGAGGGLVSQCLRWLGRHDRARVTVVTQGRNLEAQRFYQQMGFRTGRVDLWYHRWFHPPQQSS